MTLTHSARSTRSGRGSTESYELACEQKFSAGLYYWMLKTDGDILSVRKFFVR